MRAHPQRMHPGIGSPGSVDHRFLLGDRARRVLDRLLDAWPVRLALPAHEGRAVIFDGEREPRHKWVPAGIGKPRSNSPALMTPRPARWTSIGSIAPTAHAIVNPPSSPAPATPRQSAIAAERTQIDRASWR